MQKKKFIYHFGNGSAEGNKSLKSLLGGKGANLAEMSAAGLPVPPGFTITTDACDFVNKELSWPGSLKNQVEEELERLEQRMGRELGNPEKPLLVSVRSGAAVSMPGMMDTILNLGLNDEVVEGLARETGNDRFAWDSYRRFISMYGNVVTGINSEFFERELVQLKRLGMCRRIPI